MNFKQLRPSIRLLGAITNGGLFVRKRAAYLQIALTPVLDLYHARGHLAPTVDLETCGQIRHQFALNGLFSIDKLLVEIVAIIQRLQRHH